MSSRADLVKHILLALAGVIVFLWTTYLMANPLKFVLGPVLFLITFVVGELLLSRKWDQEDTADYEKSLKSSRKIAFDFLIAAMFGLSLVIIRAVPAVEGEIFVEWNILEFPSAIRLVAAFGLNFLPGYLILKILGGHELGRLSKLIASFFLSLFVMTMTGFLSALLAGIINELFLDALSLVNVALLIAYLSTSLLRWRRSSLENPRNLASSKNHRNLLPIVTVVLAIVFIASWLGWMYSSIGFFIGSPGTDMWRTHGITQTFLDYKAFTWLHIPWWFNLYLACFIFASGVPSANAYFSLYPLIALSVLSFYTMVSNLLKDRKVASLATLAYTLFSGPAWLYALYLRDFGPVTSYDDWIRTISATGDKFFFQGFYPPFVVGFTGAVIAYAGLWWTIYATCQLNLRHKLNFFLMTITVALCYLLHGVDPVIFIVYLSALLLIFLFTQNAEGKKQVGLAALSVIAALLIVSLIDLSLTPQYDYFFSWSRTFAYTFINEIRRYYYFASPSFYVLGIAAFLIFIITKLNVIQTKLMQLRGAISQKLGPKHAGSITRRSVEIVFYLYGIGLVVWVVLLPSISAFASSGFGWIPWYAYPVVGGVPLLFALIGGAILARRWRNTDGETRNTLAFCAVAIALLFTFGQLVSFVNESFFYTGFWERRTLSYIHPLVSILMAYALVTLFGRMRTEKMNFRYLASVASVALLLSLILLSSVSSTLLAGDYAARIYFDESLTKEELEALRFLHYSLPQGSQTAYLNSYTGAYIRSFAGDKWTADPGALLGQYYYPSTVVSSISRTKVQYLYINHIRDSKDLQRNLFIQQLIKVLPVEFNNSEVTIYSIPPLRAPSQVSSLSVVLPEEEAGAAYDAHVLWFFALMMSKYPYAVITNSSDPAVLNATQTIFMPYDPLPIHAEQLLEWVSNGGHVVVSNTNEYGVFADLLGLTPKVSLINCDSPDNWRTNYQRGTIFPEATLKVEGAASLRLQNNQSSWEEWIYTPSSSWDLSSHEYLGIWVYGSGGGPRWLLYLTDSNGNESYYRYDLSTFDPETRTYYPSFTGWKLHLVPIREYYGQLNLSSINKLRIVAGYTMPVDMFIDEIFALGRADQEYFTVNGIADDVSTDLPIIKVQDLSSNEDLRVVANYTENGLPVTPFAIQKDYGNGKITYLNVDLLFPSILLERVVSSPSEILAKVLEIVGIVG